MERRLILVGGFLGAGKTTLLWEAARRLAARGKRVGLITNDQAAELVDTAFLRHSRVKVSEVSGSCFCCNFQGLLDAVSTVAANAHDEMLIAEPVGSCTDLSATILQPLKDRFGSEFRIAPLSVMADPLRLREILTGGTAGLHPSAAYIFLKQLEEADIIVINKMDLLSPSDLEALRAQVKQAFPGADVLPVSARTGEGFHAWWDEVIRRPDAGQRLAEVDYDVYAEGEAVLGWLNATLRLRGEATEWNAFAERLLRALDRSFEGLGASVGHVKLLVETGDRYLAGNLTGKSNTLSIRGSAGTSSEATLILNARVEMSPSTLERIALEALASACQERIRATPVAWRCLSPGRPEPTYRYDHVVPTPAT